MGSKNSERRLILTTITLFALMLFISTHFSDSNYNYNSVSDSEINLIQEENFYLKINISSTTTTFLPFPDSSSSTVSSPPPPPPLQAKLGLSPVLRGTSCTTDKEFLSLESVINLPEMGEFSELLETIGGSIDQNDLLTQLSSLVQEQIATIQRKPCDLPNLQCGHEDTCGFGCQLHHRIGCLMMSYVTGRPLIHTVDKDGWKGAYSDKWEEVFYPLGSNCTPGSNTLVWHWVGVNYTLPVNPMPYPLKYGIPLHPGLGDLIEAFHPDPWIWMLGQFTKYAMRLNPNFETNLTEWKTEIGFNTETPIAGIQVRLTDKILKEAKNSRFPITRYLDEVEEYFQNLQESQESENNFVHRRVFVASDNSSILPEIREIHPDWEILGFEPHFSESLKERKHGLFEIVRDVEILSQTDFVVCGFTSNVCRLIHEMHGWMGFPPPQIKSLDIPYEFELFGGHSLGKSRRNGKIWKIDC